MKLFKRKKKKYKPINTIEWDLFEHEILNAVNGYRASYDLPSLVKDDRFYVEAKIRAEIQAKQGFMSHDGMEKTTEALMPFGITYTGENLADGYRTIHPLLWKWLESKKHRDNMLNPNWKYTGVAKVRDKNTGKTYYCQVFGY